MKKLSLFLAVGVMLLTAACNNGSSSDTAQTADSQKVSDATGKQFGVDVANSVVKWRATHKGGMAPRWGTIKVSDGTIAVENGNITGGSFAIDMKSLTVDSASVTEPGKKASDLQAHLQSPDFFDADKTPTAKFEITSVAKFDSTKDKSTLERATHIVSGNLTIKGNPVNISFPAKITIAENDLNAVAKFTVDRTTWGLNFHTDGPVAEWGVNKDFEVEIDLKATAK